MKVGYIADNSVPNGLPFVFLPDYNIKGLENTLKTYMSYDVDQIIFSHSNFEDPLTPGTKENLQFWLDYIKVEYTDVFIVTIRISPGPERRCQDRDQEWRQCLRFRYPASEIRRPAVLQRVAAVECPDGGHE